MVAFAIAVIVVFLFGSLVVGMIWLEPPFSDGVRRRLRGRQ
jgi:hypothetical protein